MNIKPINNLQNNNKNNRPSFGMNLSLRTIDCMNKFPQIFNLKNVERLELLQKNDDGLLLDIDKSFVMRITNKSDDVIYHKNLAKNGYMWRYRLTKELKSFFKKDFLQKMDKNLQTIKLKKAEEQIRLAKIAKLEESVKIAELSNQEDQALLDSVIPHFQSPEMTQDQAKGIAVNFINAGFKDEKQLIEFAETINRPTLETEFKKLEASQKRLGT